MEVDCFDLLFGVRGVGGVVGGERMLKVTCFLAMERGGGVKIGKAAMMGCSSKLMLLMFLMLLMLMFPF